jgi:hypothetical protein
MADRKALAGPAAGSNGLAQKPWGELSEPEQMAANARKALERIHDALQVPSGKPEGDGNRHEPGFDDDQSENQD